MPALEPNARGTFRSLRNPNYRLWAGGSFVSNIGSWMQRTAQDWLVLTGLTHHNAAAVGLVSALQFGPQLLLLPYTGWAADHFDRRRLLLATQAAMAALALGLGVLTISGRVRLWHVYGFGLLLGCVSAFDAPARQTFAGDLVGEADLANAVALNSTSFNAARLIGPAIAGLLIAGVGSGMVFLINAATFLGVIAALACLQVTDLHGGERLAARRGGLAAGFAYVWRRPDLRAVLLMLFLIGTFGINFAIYVSTMAVTVFHAGPDTYGALTSVMAVGSVAGALGAARRAGPEMRLLVIAAAGFSASLLAAALSPTIGLFALVLIAVGACAQTCTTSAASLVQLATEPVMRGRVMAILLAVALGGTPLGAPAIGWVANRFGPRWALGVGAAAVLGAALIGLRRLSRAATSPRQPQNPPAY